MFCLQCGIQLPNDAKFCGSCGYRIPQSAAVPIPKVPDPAANNKRKALICEMCNSNNLIKENDLFVCQSCGTKYTSEEAKKLLIEFTGAVRIDDSQEKNNLYSLARRSVGSKDFNAAGEYYKQILVKDPDNWEPNYYLLYTQAMNVPYEQAASAADQIIKKIYNIYKMLYNDKCSRKEKYRILSLTSSQLISLTRGWFDIASNIFNRNYNPSAPDKSKQIILQNFSSYAVPCVNIMYYLGDCISGIFGNDYADLAVNCWDVAGQEGSHLIKVTNAFIKRVSITFSTKTYNATIKKQKDILSRYDAKRSSALAEYEKRLTETREAYWAKYAAHKNDLCREYSELSTKLEQLKANKQASDRSLKELKREKSKPSVLFDKTARNEVQNKLNFCIAENDRTESDIQNTQYRMNEITAELNANRMFDE